MCIIIPLLTNDINVPEMYEGFAISRMDEGDSHLCPDGLFRMSLVSKDVYTVTPVLRDHPFCNQNTVVPLL